MTHASCPSIVKVEQAMKEIVVGVIGVGYMGEKHVSAYEGIERAKVAAICDVDERRAKWVAQKHGVKAAYTDYRDLLARDDVVAVSVCTPDQLHLDPVTAAAEAGKHILLEKPIATTLEDANRIITSARKNHVLLMVGHILRFDPRYAKAKSAIEAGDLGEVVSVWARRENTINALVKLAHRVSVTLFLGVHDIDIMRWFTASDVKRVYGEATWKVGGSLGKPMEDHVFATLRFVNGVIGGLEVGWILPSTHTGLDARAEVIGTKGMIAIDAMHGGLTMCGEKGLKHPDTVHYPEVRGVTFGDLKEELSHFLICVEKGLKPLTTGEDGRAALEIALAILKSCREGKPVSLPLEAEN